MFCDSLNQEVFCVLGHPVWVARLKVEVQQDVRAAQSVACLLEILRTRKLA